jgi:uncharacterized protein (DUF362 family)
MKSKVAVEETKKQSLSKALNNLLKKLGGIDNFIQKGDQVFLKPNMFLNSPVESGITTNPNLVIEMAKLCSELGAEVIIGERNGQIHANFSDYPKINNYARLVDLDQEEFVLKNPPENTSVINFPLPIPKIVEESDLVISLPGLRTHVLTLMSNALKNTMGFLPGKTTRLIHLAGLEEAIIDLNKIIKIDLTITDAIYSLEGAFPADSGQAKKTDFIMASTDQVALDSVAAKFMGYGTNEVEINSLAARAGLGTCDLEEINILGEEKIYNFKKPKDAAVIKDLVGTCGIYSEAACDKCVRALINGIYAFLEENNFSDLNKLGDINIITGKSFDGDLKNGKNLIYGNCAKSYSAKGEFLPGCPPLTGAVKGKLKKFLNDNDGED